MKKNEYAYYEEIKDWNFDNFEIETEYLTDWNLYQKIKDASTKESKILDLGTGGGEKLLEYYPDCAEILGTDYSSGMIETAKKNLKKSGRKNISFRLMNNLAMDVEKESFDIVVARNTVTDPKQIYQCLKKGGMLFIHGVDQYDCYGLKYLFGRGQCYHDSKPISISDYENVINAGFKEVELVPIYFREYFKNEKLFKGFLRKVPILDDFHEEDGKEFYCPKDNDPLLDQYIQENTFHGKIRLCRVCYGIVAKK